MEKFFEEESSSKISNKSFFDQKKKTLGLSFGLLFIILFIFFFVPFCGKEPLEPQWGVNFSQKHAENFGFTAEEVLSALVEDLGVQRVRLATYWDLIETKKGVYDFSALDRQIQILAENETSFILAIGVKTPRWPECHYPDWALSLSEEERKEKVLDLIRALVQRYQSVPGLFYWQVENEPFFPFGRCPGYDPGLLTQEVSLVKSLDSIHPVLLTGSGEGSFWWRLAVKGDVVGSTMYRKVWSRHLNAYFTHIFPPVFYERRAWLVKQLFGKSVLGVELQAEPWGPYLIYDISWEEQQKSMSLNDFLSIIQFARKSGFAEHYFWGAEWWYWLKETLGEESFWEEARSLFAQS